jgi:predicted small secreted protein
MRTKARVWLALALLVAAAPMLSACYTTRGAGEDLSAAGKGIEHSADKNTGYKP